MVKKVVVCFLLSIHAVTGYDTTSRVFGIGKGAAIKKLKNPSFTRHLRVFLNSSAPPEEIKVTGEKLLVALYVGKEKDDLNTLRFQRFCEKLSSSSSMAEVNTCCQQLQQQKTTVSVYFYKCKNGLEREITLIRKSGVGFVRMENSFQLQCLYLLHQRVFSLSRDAHAKQTARVGGATAGNMISNVLLLVVNARVLVAQMPEKKKQ